MSRAGRAAVLPVSFFRRDAATVAQDLLGRVEVGGAGRRRVAGRIVETEAYLGALDPASHAFAYRRFAGNQSLYSPPGTWYVYRSYGIHWCANLVAGPPGEGAAVLIRALEPLEGLALMRRRRGLSRDQQLCAGPGRLCEALGVTRALDGLRMRASPVLVLQGEPVPDSLIARTPRVGITRAAAWPLRFVVRGSPWTSGSRRTK
jgi:DNA-3-methyladenine glycosylase